MTIQEGVEPWMPNGFPPPSFLVETERTGAFATPRGRWLAAVALLGAVVLIVGLVALSRGGGQDDKTALKTAPGARSPTSTEVTFPSSTDLDPLSGGIDAMTVPVPTLPVPTLPRPATSAPQGPVSVPTLPPPAGAAPNVASTTTTQAPPQGPTISPVDGKYVHPDPGVASPCQGPWSVRAKVSDGVASVKAFISKDGGPAVDAGDLTLLSGVWSLAFGQAGSGKTTLTIHAVDKPGTESISAEESFACP